MFATILAMALIGGKQIDVCPILKTDTCDCGCLEGGKCTCLTKCSACSCGCATTGACKCNAKVNVTRRVVYRRFVFRRCR